MLLHHGYASLSYKITSVHQNLRLQQGENKVNKFERETCPVTFLPVDVSTAASTSSTLKIGSWRLICCQSNAFENLYLRPHPYEPKTMLINMYDLLPKVCLESGKYCWHKLSTPKASICGRAKPSCHIFLRSEGLKESSRKVGKQNYDWYIKILKYFFSFI